jgi:hypothetical protein
MFGFRFNQVERCAERLAVLVGDVGVHGRVRMAAERRLLGDRQAMP